MNDTTVVGRSLHESFKSVYDWVWAKLQGWKEMRLFKAGDTFLIKVVA